MQLEANAPPSSFTETVFLRKCCSQPCHITTSKNPVRPWMYRGWRHRLRRSGWLDRTAVNRCVPRLARPGTRVGVGFTNISCKPCSFCLWLFSANSFRYRSCSGCSFAILVRSASSHNFSASTCLWTRRRCSAFGKFATKLLQKSRLCEREPLRVWMNPTNNYGEKN